MKKLLIILTAVALSMPLLAVEPHRAALTEEGVFYSVDVVTTDEETIPPSTAVRLNAHSGDEIYSSIIPGTDRRGTNFEPSVAWDETSGTLFVFWVRMPSMMSAEILFTSYHDGEWSEVVSIDNDTFHYRKNLRISTTRYHRDHDEDGNEIRVPGMAIHAVWWDQDGWGETAQYAILSFDNGTVRSIKRFTLVDLIDRVGQERSVLVPEFNRSFFENPTITPHPAADGVEVIFGDVELDVLHKIDLVPVRLNGVLTIPNGLRGTDPIRPAVNFASATAGNVEIISGGAGSRQIAVVWSREGRVVFSRYLDGKWSEPKTVLLNERISRDHVLDGLRRLLGRN
jgi:hypothetical protein